MDQEGKLPPAQRVRYVANSDKRVIRRQSNLPTRNKNYLQKIKIFVIIFIQKVKETIERVANFLSSNPPDATGQCESIDTTVPKTGRRILAIRICAGSHRRDLKLSI